MVDQLLTSGKSTEILRSLEYPHCPSEMYIQRIKDLLPACRDLVQKMYTSLRNCQPAVEPPACFLLEKCCNLMYKEDYMQCLSYAEEVIDFSWEKLNSFHWKEVPLVWQRVYAYGCLFKSCCLGFMGQCRREAVCQAADMGLLMGDNVLDGILHKIIAAFKPVNDIPRTMEKPETCNRENDLTHSDVKRNITVEDTPSLDRFKSLYMDTSTPALLNGCMDHWPARTLWSFPYISKVAGHRLVPVELGSKYTDDTWGQKLMTINEFIEKYIFVQDATTRPKAYLAQHRLFDQIPQLKNDIVIPDYCCISDTDDCDPDSDTEINAWFGPGGTVSPCHYDIKHNLLAQVVGRKLVWLYPQSSSKALYPHEGILNNTSQVDVEHPDEFKFPLFPEMDHKARVELILKPGQLLYIPPKHWHYIKSIEESLSVSFWWN